MNVMSKTKRIRLHIDDLHKLKKHGYLKVDKYLISVDSTSIPQVKLFGRKVKLQVNILLIMIRNINL